MAKYKIWVVAAATLLLLAGCTSLPGTSSSSSSKATKKLQTTGKVTDSMYEGVIDNGQYKTSQTRGLTTQQSNTSFDVKSLESGLLKLSKEQFPTSKYVFQEGQSLKTAQAQKWLARKSKTNTEGLNPEDNGQKDPNKRNPIYLQQILEQDYLGEDGSMKGMSIGLGMNQVDYYTKEQYGATFETKISKAMMTQQGKQMANKVLSRMRQKKGLSDTTIVIGLYKQAPKDSLVGGTFFAYGVSKKSSTTIDSWHELNQENQVLPVVNDEKAINQDDATAFNSFKTQVETFFPNLSGVTAQTHYEEGVLAGMNITVNTQFYSETEIMSFTQYIATAADKYLPRNIPLDISITSAEGMQAYVGRASGSKGFTTHVFGSY
ncbi:CamS family sex pheromone protein [Latilactobacillus sakei]|uniref:CamS family sex pheromone protein n=1 Tax=Latilactobacillus sakei TaxID=1599 RepID=UPI00019CF866|nr:CamS family sex pheromone protein [Latilactobacillus sakei]GEP21966.1 CamS family sex pheromone protein [Latilactobacillus sakei subsp. carnosus]